MKLILHCLMKSRTDSISLRAANFCFTVINVFESQIHLILVMFPPTTIAGPSVGQFTQMFDFDLCTTGLLILLSYFPERPVDFLSAGRLPGRLWFPVHWTVVWKFERYVAARCFVHHPERPGYPFSVIHSISAATHKQAAHTPSQQPFVRSVVPPCFSGWFPEEPFTSRFHIIVCIDRINLLNIPALCMPVICFQNGWPTPAGQFCFWWFFDV